jgi:FlaA1/EpsC-like NDP-sugar epimerase
LLAKYCNPLDVVILITWKLLLGKIMRRHFFTYLPRLNRQNKIILQSTADITLLTASFLAAIFARFESLEVAMQFPVWGAFFSSTLATFLVFWRLCFYQVVIRFLTGKILVILGKGVVVAGISLHAAGLLFDANLPTIIPFVFAIFAFFSIGGLRFAARKYFLGPDNLNKRPVIIYGAGEAGRQLLNALFHGKAYIPVAMVDDSPSINNLIIGGLEVYPPSKIPDLIESTGAKIILLAMPESSPSRRQDGSKYVGNYQRRN